MGFLDALLGRRKVSGPAPDRLFALSTAYVDLEASHGIRTKGRAGIVFQALATADFQQIVSDTEELLRGTGGETGTRIETSDDEFGYRWMSCCATPTSRTSWSRSTRWPTASRSAATATGSSPPCSPSRTPPPPGPGRCT